MVLLDGSHLTFDEVRRVSSEDEAVGIAPEAVEAMKQNAKTCGRSVKDEQDFAIRAKARRRRIRTAVDSAMVIRAVRDRDTTE